MLDAEPAIEHEGEGEYLELDPPHRLRFTWRSRYTGKDASIVTVELSPSDEGTRLILTHERLPDGATASHGAGWGAMLDRLETLVASSEAAR